MSGRAFVNVAWCGEHRKGNENNHPCDPAGHAEWLLECVRDLVAVQCHRVVVSMTGFPGMVRVPAGRERDALWQVSRYATLVGVADNPGHQAGAAWCIRQGLEFGGKLGFDYMVHTAEDIVLKKDDVRWVVERLRDGADYVGAAWGPGRDELSSQFFGCRVPHLAAVFDPGKVAAHSHLERYLAHELAGKNVVRVDLPYRHTHDITEWRRFLAEARATP